MLAKKAADIEVDSDLLSVGKFQGKCFQLPALIIGLKKKARPHLPVLVLLSSDIIANGGKKYASERVK